MNTHAIVKHKNTKLRAHHKVVRTELTRQVYMHGAALESISHSINDDILNWIELFYIPVESFYISGFLKWSYDINKTKFQQTTK